MNLRSALRWGGHVVVWMTLLSAVAVLSAAVFVPRLGGATPYVILTGSMQPDMPPGTLVVVKPVDADAITTGTVITYQIESGKPDVVTHRVVSVGLDGTGELRFGTQGDANTEPDAHPVQPVQIKGERWYYVPYFGYVTSFVTGEQRKVGLTILVVALFGYAGAMFLGAARDRRRTKEVQHG